MRLTITLIFALSFLVLSCGGGSDTESQNQNAAEGQKTNEYGLTEFEMEFGIGPIKKRLYLPQINKALAKQGEDIFKLKCSACHKLDERYIGPAQRYATERRPPEYLINMMLNPDEMTKRHPEAKKLLVEYLSPMTYQNISEQDARNIIDYLRLMAKEGREQNIPEIPVFKNQTKIQNK
jgi:mono/diheme cytochrome c family protein